MSKSNKDPKNIYLLTWFDNEEIGGEDLGQILAGVDGSDEYGVCGPSVSFAIEEAKANKTLMETIYSDGEGEAFVYEISIKKIKTLNVEHTLNEKKEKK